MSNAAANATVAVWKPICCLVVGTICLLWGIWATHLYYRMTPIYVDMTCSPGKASLKDLRLGAPLISPTSFTVLIETVCTNPNFYSIQFSYSEPGKVFLGDDPRVEVGEAMEAPFSNSSLPAGGNGSVWTEAKVHINAQTLLKVGSFLVSSSGVPLYLELNQQMHIGISFFFGQWGVKKWIRKKCGLRIGSLS